MNKYCVSCRGCRATCADTILVDGGYCGACRRENVRRIEDTLKEVGVLIHDRLFAKFKNLEGWTITEVLHEINDEMGVYARAER